MTPVITTRLPLQCLVALLLVTGIATARVASAQAVTSGGIEISHDARSIQPGELVRIRALLPDDAMTVTGHALDKPLRFYRGASGVWHALIGIDLDAKPSVIPIVVGAVTGGGLSLRSTYDLVVESKEFPTRRLTVDESYVNPPPDVIDRIQREARRVQEIFGTETDNKLWSRPFARPVPGQATSSFGKRSILNGEPRSPHSGTDFQGAAGTPVKAPNTGRVVLAENLYFSGNVVILDHGWGLYSYLAHLSRIDVEEGQVITVGDIVGAVGATGRVTGPHLHWTVRVNGARVDSLSLMSVLK